MPTATASGFSLAELLLTLALIALLVTLAVPSYSGLLAKARRVDGMAALTQVQLAQQRWRAKQQSYTVDLRALGWSAPLSPQGYYRLDIVQADEADFRALAQPAGVQASDSCGVFALGADGPVYDTPYAAPHCWHR